MKYFLLFIFFTAVTALPIFSQQDTTFQQADEKRGFALFGGLGFGANGIKQGFARGLTTRFHYQKHTFDASASRTTKYEAGYASNGGRDLTLTYDSYNFGLNYGVGVYEKHFSAACVAGIGHSNTDMIVFNDDRSTINYGTFVHKNYIRTTACLGLQGAWGGQNFRFGLKGYCNIFNGPSTFTLLAGLELNFGH